MKALLHKKKYHFLTFSVRKWYFFKFFRLFFDNLMTNEFSLVVDFGLFPLDWSIPIARTVMIFNVPVMLFRVKTSYNVSSRKDQCGFFFILS
ncbi:hypothetical protein MY43_12535 [Listeria monocytogenes]|nr:hypothetical protein [Listeria monocytogenes]